MAYPYPGLGYCQESDVIARIKLGAYNVNVPGNITPTYVDQYILQSATEIDMVLAKAGYTLATGGGLVAKPGQVIAAQANMLLLNINATLAAGKVELWRHAENASSEDSQADRLLKTGRFMLSRLETGADNLSLFGVDGGFEMQPDPSQSMNSNMDDPDPMTGQLPSPLFSVVPSQQSANSPLTQW